MKVNDRPTPKLSLIIFNQILKFLTAFLYLNQRNFAYNALILGAVVYLDNITTQIFIKPILTFWMPNFNIFTLYVP